MQTSWQREGPGAELERLLAPLQRRLWWREGAHLVLRTLCLVFGGLFVVAALAVTGLAPSPGGAVGVVAVGLALAALALALGRPPSLLATARSIDRAAGLAERVGTAAELAAARSSGPTVAVQVSDAADRVRRLRPAEAVPLGGTRQEAALASGLGLLAAGMLLLAGLGQGLPGGLLPLRQMLEAALAAVNPPAEDPHAAAQERGEIDARLAPLLQQLEALRGGEAGLSPEDAAARRAAAAQQLAEMAAASRAQQEALAELARALQNSAAGREVADNLLQGDYARAAEALAALGRESDQLSTTGRRQFADALRQAQSAIRPLSPELADRAQRAAQALSGRDYRRTEQALDQLAEAVAQAGRGVVPQSDLGMLGEALAEQGEDLDAALAALAEMGAGASGSSDGRGSGPPGVGPGSGAAGRADPLGAAGAPMPLDSLPSLDGAPGQGEPDPDRPSVLAPVSIGATGGGAPAGGSAPLTATGETAPVPTERREVVRGYFGAEGGR
jgi:hypothetical protein